MPAKFIVLDGPDGSGTTTHAALLAEALRARGERVVLTAEPTPGPIGQWIRSQLRDGLSLPPSAIQLMFCADRAQHVEDVIRPALGRGETVISDRYSASTVAYGAALGLDADWLRSVNTFFIQPSHHLFLLPPLDVCMQRMQKRGETDAFEKRDLQELVHAAYRQIAASDAGIHIVDSSGEKDLVSQAIAALIPVS